MNYEFTLALKPEPEIMSSIPPQLKENALAFSTLFQNTIDLFLNELNDIDKPTICPTCTTCEKMSSRKR